MCIDAALTENNERGGVLKQDQTPTHSCVISITDINYTDINYTDEALRHVNKYSRSSIKMIMNYTCLHGIISFEAKITA